MPAYDTVSQAIQGLKERGFTTDLNLAFDCLVCADNGVCLSPEAFEIVEHHRFEGASDPADEAMVYGIASMDGTIKGTLVTAYGMYSEPHDDALLRKLKVQA